MVYSKEQVDRGIAEFKARLETEQEFCEQLFIHATTRLLAFKFAYYALSQTIVKDATYDNEESGWFVMGRALGVLEEEDTSPCVDWDPTHALAGEAEALARKLLRL